MKYSVKENKGIKWLVFERLDKYKEFVHFITIKNEQESDSFNLGFKDNFLTERVIENRKKLASALNINVENFIFSQQIHSNNIKIISDKDKGKGVYDFKDSIKENDGYFLKEKSCCPIILTADCASVIFYEPKHNLACLVHCGWKGLIRGILNNAKKIFNDFNVSLKNILVGIGPSVKYCCYKIDYNLINLFKENLNVFNKEWFRFKNSIYFDLQLAIKDLLIYEGFNSSNIDLIELCTICNSKLFFSYRREKENAGRIATGIMLIP